MSNILTHKRKTILFLKKSVNKPFFRLKTFYLYFIITQTLPLCAPL